MHPNDTTTSVDMQLIDSDGTVITVGPNEYSEYHNDDTGHYYLDGIGMERHGETLVTLYAPAGSGPAAAWSFNPTGPNDQPHVFYADSEDLYLRLDDNGRIYDVDTELPVEHLLSYGWLLPAFPNNAVGRGPLSYRWDADTICHCSFCQTSPYSLLNKDRKKAVA